MRPELLQSRRLQALNLDSAGPGRLCHLDLRQLWSQISSPSRIACWTSRTCRRDGSVRIVRESRGTTRSGSTFILHWLTCYRPSHPSNPSREAIPALSRLMTLADRALTRTAETFSYRPFQSRERGTVTHEQRSSEVQNRNMSYHQPSKTDSRLQHSLAHGSPATREAANYLRKYRSAPSSASRRPTPRSSKHHRQRTPKTTSLSQHHAPSTGRRDVSHASTLRPGADTAHLPSKHRLQHHNHHHHKASPSNASHVQLAESSRPSVLILRLQLLSLTLSCLSMTAFGLAIHAFSANFFHIRGPSRETGQMVPSLLR